MHASLRYTCTMSTHLHTLERAGLSDKEAAVYLTLLQLSESNAQTLATQSKVKRGTVYTIVDSLMKKGLVSSAEKAGKQLFYPEDPAKIEALLKEKRETLERTEADVREAMGELRRLHYSGGTRPVVRYFEGEEGLKELLKEVRGSSKEKGMSFTDLDCTLQHFPGIYAATDSPRIRAKRRTKILYTSSHGPVVGVKDEEKFRDARWVSFAKHLDFEGDITIYDNKISITSYRAPTVSIVIEHEDITRLVEALFTLAWEGAQEREEPKATCTLHDIDRSID